MDLLVHPSATETTTGNSNSFDNGNLVVGALFVNVTAASGTLPTLVVKIQHSPDGSIWYDVPGLATTSIAGILSVAVHLSTLTPLSDHLRCVWTIGGVSPSFTFTADLTVLSL